ncbi:MAG: extracellular solute-binding protein [Sphaerochaeta sp.]|nr:extracellular solute-binding protein [Sphaerochaeta sp.]
MKNLMKTVFLVTLVALIGITGAFAQGQTGKASGPSNELIIYSPNSELLISTLVPMFEKETGIKCEIISAGTGELLKRIESEKNAPYADVLFGGTYNAHLQNIESFAQYVSPNDKALIAQYQNKTGRITSYVLDGNVILVNTNLIGDIKIEGYEDLLHPALKGKIAHADAASSSSAFNHVANMLLNFGNGNYEDPAGWEFVRKFLINLNGKIASGSGAVHRSVADGEYVVGLTWEDPAVDYIRNGIAPVKVVHPKKGAQYAPSATAIVKGAPNLDNAKKFVDFILSEKAQSAIGLNLNNRPLRVGIPSADYMTPIEDIKLVSEDTEYILKHKQEIVDRYIDTLTSI